MLAPHSGSGNPEAPERAGARLVHREVRREEARLLATFGDDYAVYVETVPRYG
jgi:hypothetical protein